MLFSCESFVIVPTEFSLKTFPPLSDLIPKRRFGEKRITKICEIRLEGEKRKKELGLSHKI
ncbi:hypothetical protein CH380_03340 [Leptospira adleri]|uniref:Uncharacterized protein n=1 Tax=Leptospira adleri TaxID=2023186 RepID=A0A2M9YT93_9LEPT|nr:hypothetical protein CH380_03340 [Leptospira adleri]PJZ61425.1 hypothetical protein CH376_13065 [Leptospira adleri]